MPDCLSPHQFPPSFALNYHSGYQGWDEPCIGQVYQFVDGSYQRDQAKEHTLYEAKFKKLKLTEAQIAELAGAHTSPLDDWSSATDAPQALGDFVYYGTLSGHSAEITKLLHKFPPHPRKELQKLSLSLMREQQTNLVVGSVRPLAKSK